MARGEMAQKASNTFFFAAAIVLLCLVFAGFAPTFFLKRFFDTPPLPPYLIVHGFAFTALFGTFVVQTWLIRRQWPQAHRWLGRVAIVLAALLAVTTVFVIADASASTEARGIVRTISIETLVIGDFAALIAFVALMTIAITYRHQTDIHKRSMLLAFIALANPAIARITNLTDLGPAFIPVISISLMASLWIHDLWTQRRIHTATVIGTAPVVGLFLGAQVLAGSPLGTMIVEMISTT
jgi:hypothetical protein